MESKKVYKWFSYQNDLSWSSARRGMMVSPGKTQVEVGSPPEFKGAEGVWSPEELLVGSLNACLMLAFVAYANSKGLEFASYKSHAEGRLENVDGKYRITEITVQPAVELKSEADVERAGELMKSAKDGCFISNSVTARVEVSPQFRVVTN